MRPSLRLLVPGILPLLLPCAGVAQEYLRLTGKEDFDGFGMSLALLGDLDHDGWPDIAVGAYCTDKMGHNNGGSVTAFSSRTGTQLWMTNGDSADERLGHCMQPLGDVNGDGYVDLVVGAYRDRLGGLRSGSVHVLSGRWGQRLYTVVGDEPGAEFGKSVAAVGDLDGDGVSEWIAGWWLSNAGGPLSGQASLHSGADGRRLRTWVGVTGSETGTFVAGLGDVTGDGIPDFAIGAPRAYQADGPHGMVAVRSGADGALVHELWGPLRSDFGFAICGPGDVDGDGRRDLVVGAPQENGSEDLAGAAYVYSGADWSELLRVEGREQGEGLGWFVGPAGDVDGDARADWFCGIPQHPLRGYHTGHLRIHAGASDTVLRSWSGWSEIDKLGSVALALPDLDGDGRDDWLVGAPEAGFDPAFEPGAAILYLDQPRPLVQAATLQAGATGDLLVTGIPKHHRFEVYASLTGVGATLRGSEVLDLATPILIHSGQSRPNGNNHIQGTLPAHLQGLRLHFQAIDLDAQPDPLTSATISVVVQ